MFLLADTPNGYQVSSVDTLWPILFIGVVTVLFWVFRVKIRESKARKIIPYLLLAFMIIFEIGLFRTIINAPFTSFDTTVRHLPLHLCSTSAVMVIVFLITRKRIFLELLFYQGIVGAIVTFVFPSTSSFPYQYDYWRFFLSHSILFITPIFFYVIEGFRPNKRTLVIALITTHIIAAIATTMNLIIDHDYMYLTPDNTRNLYAFIPLHDMIPVFAKWPMVILFGEMLVFPVYFAVFGVFRFVNKVTKSDLDTFEETF